MSIFFSKLFDQEINHKFGISREYVRQAIENCTTQTKYKLDELEVNFYLRHIDFTEQTHFLLVCTQKKGDDTIVDLAFKILPSMIDDLGTLEPLIVLQELAQRFGLNIRIGRQLNKFIIDEIVSIDADVEFTKISEIINPSNHSFLQSIFIKIEHNEDKRLIKCAIAYCIDSDKYLDWLGGKSEKSSSKENFLVEIKPEIKGHITVYDLINSSGTLNFVSNYSELGGDKSGFIFRLHSESFHFEVGFTSNSFYIQRNSDLLEWPLHPVFRPKGYVVCFAMWEPTNLSLSILDETYQEAIKNLPTASLVEQETDRRKITLKTFTTLPPFSFINWIRKASLLPETTYESINDFNLLITSMFQSIQDKIGTIGLISPFWNIIYDGPRIVDRIPKHEPDIHPIIHGLLYDQALIKNVQIVPEYPIAGGNLDFLLAGFLKSGDIANVFVEFKLAHSQDLENGLIKQLPAYMHAKGCDYGIYCILYFKGPDFPEPSKYKDITKLGIYLHNRKSEAGLGNIRIYFIDVSQIIPPSKL